jgi:two-component system LytT family response regulator
MTLRAVIVDDEPLARSRLRSLLHSEDDLEIIGEGVSVGEAVTLIEKASPDVIFLDVQMPDGSGFDVLRRLGSRTHAAVIFTTAYTAYAVEAFDGNAADYLVKPFDAERVSRALHRARRLIHGPSVSAAETRAAEPRERFAVPSHGEIIFVKASDVDWISAEGNYVRLHCGASSYLLRESTQHLDESLDRKTFIRVHRSAIVNLSRVRKLVPSAEGSAEIVLANGQSVPLGPSYRHRLEEVLGLR